MERVEVTEDIRSLPSPGGSALFNVCPPSKSMFELELDHAIQCLWYLMIHHLATCIISPVVSTNIYGPHMQLLCSVLKCTDVVLGALP